MPKPSVGTAEPAAPSPSDRLFEPIDPAPLVYFRVVFGALMLWDVAHFALIGAIRPIYLDPAFLFTYDGFGWVRPLPGRGMHAVFFLLAFLAALVLLGLYYRIAAALFTAGYAYVFLLCKSMYMNHYYLVALLGLAMTAAPGQRPILGRRGPRPRDPRATGPRVVPLAAPGADRHRPTSSAGSPSSTSTGSAASRCGPGSRGGRRASPPARSFAKNGSSTPSPTAAS